MKKLSFSITQKQLAVLSVIAFSLSLAPLVAIGFFNHPSMDDFIYLSGWVSHRLLCLSGPDLERVTARFGRIKVWFYASTLGLACVLLVLNNPCLTYTPTVNALAALKRGEAQTYDRQIKERLELLNDPAVEDVVLEPLEYTPYLLFRCDMSTGRVDEYYGKKSVTLVEAMPTTQD